MIRPEKIGLEPADGAVPDAMTGAVEDAVYVGEFTRYRVRVGHDVTVAVKSANTHTAFRAKPGERVRLRWNAADGYLVPPS